MKIFAAAQIREWDAYTIAHEPIKSIDLMERASQAFVDIFIQEISSNKPVHVFAGPGNNGGDGLAIARLLLDKGYRVKCTVAAFSDNYSNDFLINEKNLATKIKIAYVKSMDEIPSFDQEVIIDALFGTGINRPVEGLPGMIIKAINESGNKIYAVDIPSGMSCDKSLKGGATIFADRTITFQTAKLTFFFPENEKHLGRWNVANIGLHPRYLEETSSEYYYIQKEWTHKIVRPRTRFAHKGTYGHALLVAGSFGKMGAAIMSSKACLRTGTGLLTAHIPHCGYEIMQQSIAEVMTLVDVQQDFITTIPDMKGFSAIGIGPGMGTEINTRRALEDFLCREELPYLIIDADGLNMLAEQKELLAKLPPKTILTPHPGEFKRLVGEWVNDTDRLERQKMLAQENNVIVVLKGANTSIALPDGTIYFNSTGNPGMATGGSGDVLTGIILGLLSQGYSPEDAACLGVFMHGYAGDKAAQQRSEPSMIATDIIDHIGDFYLDFA